MARPKLSLGVEVETFPFVTPFRITGHVFADARIITVALSDSTYVGHGEASGVYFLGEDIASMTADIERVRGAVEEGATRDELRHLLPAGGARNAIDCAMWALEARRDHTPVWKTVGLAKARPSLTTFTIGAADPDAMAQDARRYADARALKLKLTGDARLDIERVKAVRAARPDAWVSVDANQGFDIDGLAALVQGLGAADVKMIEQPLPRSADADLEGFFCHIPIAADESVRTLADVEALSRRFDVVNIKLDKCGGLTEGLAMAKRARALGFQVMVGNMVSTSLAIGPAFLLGQLCDIVDLDGPIFLAADRTPSVQYRNGLLGCTEGVWGGTD